MSSAFLLSACGSNDQQTEEPLENSPVAGQAPLTADGWGPLTIGMSRAEVVAALGSGADRPAVSGAGPAECEEFRPTGAPPGMLVMIEQGRLSRISLEAGSELKTEEGFGVGDRAAALRAAYGDRAITTPHKYEPAPSEYITVWMTRGAGRDARGIVYEIGADAHVRYVHAGDGSIQYVEGCL